MQFSTNRQQDGQSCSRSYYSQKLYRETRADWVIRARFSMKSGFWTSFSIAAIMSGDSSIIRPDSQHQIQSLLNCNWCMSKEQRKPRYVLKKNQAQTAPQKPEREPQPFVPKPDPPKPRYHKPELPKKRSYIQKKASQPQELCMVCSENIQVREAIWNCRCCYQFMHLACIKKWIFNLNKDNKKKERYNWSCPQCKYEYAEALPEYFCFCGKFKNPEYESGIPAHSCGSYCERKRGFYCPHPCPDVCHSGRCRPCTYEGIEITCGCGKSKMNIRCSDQKQSFVCGKKCEKLLNCGKHKCSQNCHEGFCNPCSYKHLATCYCGKNDSVIDCVETSYPCDDICGKPLDCGNHTCQDKCHKGQCRSCNKKPELVKTCPCGQFNISLLVDAPRTKCTDPIPICGMPCKKVLVCGHLCPNSCHEGPCKPCKVQVVQKCQCQSANRKAQCWQLYDSSMEFRCEKMCKHRKSCGQHFCNKECCEFRNSTNQFDHQCLLICQKQLNCGRHTCGLPCHSGNCGRCPVLYSQPQPCPCGKTFLRAPVVCGTIVPQCSNLCGKLMQCSHLCTLTCHYGPCKCFQKVIVECECGKNKIQTTCGKAVLCTEKCEKMLPCGHICGVQCHKGECPFGGDSDGCMKVCNKKRVVCEHVCLEKCHPKVSCDTIPCKTEVSVKCECGNRVSMAECGSTNVRLEKKIQCNKSCENMKRFSDLFKERKIYYPNGLVYFGMKNWKYVQKVEESLVQFIKSGAPSLHLDFTKFVGNGPAKYHMHTLFEKHYNLDVTFYSNRKTTFFTLSPTKTTMVPQPSLHKYIQMLQKGEIKRNSVPFSASIKLAQLTKDRADTMEGLMSEFAHHFYSEKKEKQQYFHFWLEEHARDAIALLRDKYPGYTFTLEVSPKEDEIQAIAPEEIFEEQVENTPEEDKEEAEEKKEVDKLEQDEPNQEKIVEQNIGGKEEEKKEEAEVKEKTIEKTPEGTEKPKEQTKKPEQQPPKASKKPEFFGKKKYPPSSEYVQLIYETDDDELYTEPKDWDEYIERITPKELGIEASEWRIRSLIILRALNPLETDPTKVFIQKLMELYKQQQVRARRTLSIRNIQLKKTKQVLQAEGLILSGNQPEIVSYGLLLNPDVNPNSFLSDQLIQTPQIQKAHEILHCLQSHNHQVFFHTLLSSDFMTACTLLPYLNQMRLFAIEQLISKGKGKVHDINAYWKNLFFDSQELFYNFLATNKYKYLTRESKKTPGRLVFVVSRVKAGEEGELPVGEGRKQVIRHSKLLMAKRDAEFAFGEEPTELFQDKYCLKSYFAFGDHKDENCQYVTKLIKSLRRK